MRRARGPWLWTGVVVAAACGGEPSAGPPVEVTVPPGASFAQITDTLAARHLVGAPRLFRMYARIRGADTAARSGRYVFRTGAGWSRILDALVAGRVETEEMTIPEGFTLREMAPRIAEITALPVDSVAAYLAVDSMDRRFGVPGPGLEGYLFPDTYRFAHGAPLENVVETMVERYRKAWGDRERARLDSLGMSEKEAVTLASIVQAEARKSDEMPIISAVYHNRLDRGYALQADPTVLYALGGHRDRLLFAAIDSVAANPYNTYTHPGLPPGPIGAPGEAALHAALHPADESYLYFVARPDGSHFFSHSLQEHNRARVRARREWDEARRNADTTADQDGSAPRADSPSDPP